MSPVTKAATAEQVFAPQWPVGLDMNERVRVFCDDKHPHESDAHLDVMTGPDGDAYASMGERRVGPHEDPLDGYSILPGIRVRTWAGGGRNLRTHQALLWLALAIKLDAAES